MRGMKTSSEKSNLCGCVAAVCVSVALSVAFAEPADRPELGSFRRLMFNNPGLEVDLGLGIWPHAEVFDYDGDGKMDVFVRAGCVPFKDARVYINRSSGKSPTTFAAGFSVPDNTGRQRTVTGGHPATDGLKSPHPNKPHTMRWNFVDLDGDGVEDVVLSLSDWTNYGCPGPKCPIAYDANCVWTNRPIETYLYYFHNEGGNGKDAKWAKPVAIRTPNCKTDALEGPWGGYAVMFDDWDRDGDKDFICGEFIDNFWYFENVGGKGNPRFVDGRKVLVEDGSPLAVELCFYDPRAVDFNGDGLKDLIAAEEDGRVSYYENTGRLKDGIPVFTAGRFLRQEAQELKFGCLCTPFGVDWDGDGDYDFICGNSSGCIAFIENLSGQGVVAPKWAEPKYITVGGRRIRTIAGPSGSPQGPAEAKWGYSSVSVGDWDGDGILDILANDIDGDVRLYLGIGRGGTEMTQGVGLEVEWNGGVQPLSWWEWRPHPGKCLRAPWRTTVEMIDWNGDGLQDVVVMDTEGFLALYERFRDGGGILRLKHPQRIFIDEKGNPLRFGGEKAASGRARFRLADWDGDGRMDILNANWNVHFWRQVGEKGGKAVFRNMKTIGKEQLQGHCGCPATVDFDGDGRPEAVFGAEDGYFYYMRNPNSVNRGKCGDKQS